MKTLQHSAKPRRQSGFTLIELVMIITILGILSIVVSPKFLDISSDAKRAVSQNHHGVFNATMVAAFAQHHVQGGANNEENRPLITDCSSLQQYLEGGAFPQDVTCSGSQITYPDGTASTITAETKNSRARLGDRSASQTE